MQLLMKQELIHITEELEAGFCSGIDNIKSQSNTLRSIINIVMATILNKGTIYIIGNGGSASQASHMATELVVRYKKNRLPISAISLTTDSALITAAGNDFSFDDVFLRQVSAHLSNNDVLFVFSTSGESTNIIKAASYCVQSNIQVLGVSKAASSITKKGIFIELDPQISAASAQQVHLAIAHILSEYIENAILE